MTLMSPMQSIKSAQAFGKYTGMPIEEVMASYVPRHSAMQARFLDPGFRLKTVALSYFDVLLDEQWYSKRAVQSNIDFETGGFDVLISIPAETIWCESSEMVLASTCISASVFIDVVPDIGDDYPLLLRLLKEQSVRAGVDNRMVFATLVYDKFIAEGITEDEFAALFKECGFSVLRLSDIEDAPDIEVEAHIAKNVGCVTGERGRTEDKFYLIDIPCRQGGAVHLKTTLGRSPLSLKFDDMECSERCRLCQEMSAYTLLCVDTCHKE